MKNYIVSPPGLMHDDDDQGRINFGVAVCIRIQFIVQSGKKVILRVWLGSYYVDTIVCGVTRSSS